MELFRVLTLYKRSQGQVLDVVDAFFRFKSLEEVRVRVKVLATMSGH